MKTLARDHLSADRVGLALALTTLAACGGGGTDVGNPVDLGVHAYNPRAPGALARLANGDLQVDAAWLVVSDVRLRVAPACEDDGEARVQDDVLVDLLDDEIPAALRELTIAPGPYCRLELDWHAGADLPDAPADLDGAALMITGSLPDDTPFEIRSRHAGGLRLDARDGAFDVTAGQPALFVGLDLMAWLAAVDFDAVEVGDDGVILIDDDHNRDQLDAFEGGLDAAARLFRDQDDDGVLGDDEHDDDDALADGA
jgi:hypothetical protein